MVAIGFGGTYVNVVQVVCEGPLPAVINTELQVDEVFVVTSPFRESFFMRELQFRNVMVE